MILKLSDLDLTNKNVFLRVDYNVPIDQGLVSEPHRIESTLPTIKAIMAHANKLILASHLGRPDGKVVAKYGLGPVKETLQKILNQPVELASDCVGDETSRMIRESTSHIILLENLRFHKEEEQNDAKFSHALAGLADIYINDAFGAAHRAHASIAGMAAFFKQKAAGLLMQKELDYLSPILSQPAQPFVMVLGGAKVSDKIGVIRNLLPKVKSLLIGGGMAYTFLKAKGHRIGKSLVENDKLDLANDLIREASQNGVNLMLPTDHVTGDSNKLNPVTSSSIADDQMGLDIGPATIAAFCSELEKAKLVLWNGPVGLFEVPPYDRGSRALAAVLARNYPQQTTVIAGGDTVAAVNASGVQDRISHLSTGGGATLEFLEGKQLPGIRALEV